MESIDGRLTQADANKFFIDIGILQFEQRFLGIDNREKIKELLDWFGYSIEDAIEEDIISKDIFDEPKKPDNKEG